MTTSTAPGTRTDEWNLADIDLAGYLARTGHPAVEAPTAAALRSLAEAHVRAIPFENIDVVLGQHKGIDVSVINSKILRGDRGGYCYEHQMLFGGVLERLGYRVRRLMARGKADRSGPHTHMMLVVTAEGQDFLTDIGYGANMLRPIPLVDGVVVDQGGWELRLEDDNGWWVLSKRVGDEWEVMYGFDLIERRRVDYEVAHHYVSTHPKSPFTGQTVVMRLEPGLSRRLVGHTLTVERPDGTATSTEVAAEDLDRTLRELGVVLTASELAALRATW
ncbi:arylamine N-acetyltransferase family protein [Allokutzneria albata]|uniref:N-hydroxyarylamine O-acetyltransferase n=1 Tax=Allokutzneria albata TaxID=211114 RepID=A0A1G9RG88_ALLAB|nr:arylamine N-acetyltransferase [Allokutzneria albata]SDM21455.1 N-hydroxyarylamine O-acetyltransferase [Allokutzneria albata]